ncbi:MAG: NAD(P)H-hydrate dehydratase [Bacteroidales bacterium]|nr:NAD(P)H-hydrate dehydratase [Bacteroidales bacterium]
MKILSSDQIRKADAYTIENEPIESVELMERAAVMLADWFDVNIDVNENIEIFAGPGNNGGDAWALARLLTDKGYTNINMYLLDISGRLSPDSEINRKRLIQQGVVSIKYLKNEVDFPSIKENDWVVDGLFGSGLTRELTGLPLKLVKLINNSSNRGVIAIDIPSGLFCTDNSKNNIDGVIKANVTLTFQVPKLAFFMAENSEFVGEFVVLDIKLHRTFLENEPTGYFAVTHQFISKMVKHRKKFSHKGSYGHGLLIAGSYGMMGAAVLASRAALRSGIGLLTTHIPRCGYETLQISVPESILCIDESDFYYTGVNCLNKYQAIALGPGLNTKKNTAKAIKQLFVDSDVTLVIDADALNIVAKEKILELVPKGSVLTPHPKEFDRLTKPHSTHFERVQTQVEISKKYGVFVILKGAHTSISLPAGDLYFNTTGNPGMATGGSGDVLTGILLALISQGYLTNEAVLMAPFIHGLAADIGAEKLGEISLVPSDIISYLSSAFLELTN